MNITEANAAAKVLQALHGRELDDTTEAAAALLAEKAGKALLITGEYLRIPPDAPPPLQVAPGADPTICPACGEHGDLVETGYDRSWSTHWDGTQLIAHYTGTEDWTETGNGDDHLECRYGHSWPIPDGVEVDHQ